MFRGSSTWNKQSLIYLIRYANMVGSFWCSTVLAVLHIFLVFISRWKKARVRWSSAEARSCDTEIWSNYVARTAQNSGCRCRGRVRSNRWWVLIWYVEAFSSVFSVEWKTQVRFGFFSQMYVKYRWPMSSSEFTCVYCYGEATVVWNACSLDAASGLTSIYWIFREGKSNGDCLQIRIRIDRQMRSWYWHWQQKALANSCFAR